ncbi:2OG-Fe(II) oxygenase [Nocardioides sp. AE5]|uniref:2OG-Fe(II) oxygenase n=1 Tax=Nocardioides sp. AE5 TaxID=2962573 RepID=UPI0028816834|nr:2OG-Fe(II) oxygenase [Nocardioides sp. AE5]MDT0202243.1 2OG-Fe(II) oxygenase [Nocardioides sp. AE5]
MAKLAREKIALLLRGDDETGSFSVETSAPAAGVTLSVDGVGPVKLPVGAPQERALVSVARPAMFGRGEETLTDTSVRDTWELTADQVTLGGAWDQVLDEVLLEVHEGLGLPRGARLRAEMHALLVYGPDQFFAPHQDSEKGDEMVATLVVSLPSVHSGGELLVSHGSETRSFRHSDRGSIGFVAFYADCVHEVRPVRSGRRVTLTFNVFLSQESGAIETDPEEELASLLSEHFSTPVPRRWSDELLPAPNRLVVLLDHQYSQRGLTSGRLKGRDVEWVRRLRAAADRVGALSALALAEVHQTWTAEEDHRSWRHTYDDTDDWNVDGAPAYEVGELIEDEVSLGWWKRSGTGSGEQIRLGVDESEVSALTPTASLAPYQSEYEGYMGNYGNTLDYWYRRAAIVLWPGERDFIARAEADLPQAVLELGARLSSMDDLERARADARELVGLLGAGNAGPLTPLLSIGHAVDDPDLAHDLLARLGGEVLGTEHAVALATTVERYGKPWGRRLIEAWFPVGGYRRGPWTWASETLPGLAPALRESGAEDVVIHVCRRIWASMAIAISLALELGPRARAASMEPLVSPAAALFATSGDEQVGEFVGTLAAYDDGVLDLERPLLRRLGAEAPRALVEDAVRRLEIALEAPPRLANDWSIAWSGCGCELCEGLQAFLSDRDETELDWPLRADRRQHIHQRIDAAELPVTHRTIRKGSPYVLRLTKDPRLHEMEGEQRRRATVDLAWLRSES